MKSIRRSLLASLLLSILLGASLTAWKIYVDFRSKAIELFDRQLIQVSYAVPYYLLPASDDALPKNSVDDDDPNRQLAILVWMGDATKPTYYSPKHVPLTRPQTDGLSTEVIAGQLWRTYGRVMPDRTIAVAQPIRTRSDVLTELTWKLATHIALLAPALALIVWFLVSRGLKPLTRFAMELETRSPTELQNISANNLPEELLPVANALNDLMDRLQHVLIAQKNFIGDAAHEILTPLAALQVQVQVLDRAKTEQRQAQAMHDVQTSLERCVNLARQLLELARNSTELAQSSVRVVDLIGAARYAVEEALPKAHHRQIDLGMLVSGPVTISGDELAIHVLLRNLIDNAIKYSPVGSRVDVAIHNADAVHLVVSDSGPGVPTEEHARLFDRFYRGSNPDIDGTGLGLAIVKEIAQRHNAEIELKSPGLLGGLDVIVRFPKVLEKA